MTYRLLGWLAPRRHRRTTPAPLALVPDTAGWQPVPEAVAEWMGMQPFAPESPESRVAM